MMETTKSELRNRVIALARDLEEQINTAAFQTERADGLAQEVAGLTTDLRTLTNTLFELRRAAAQAEAQTNADADRDRAREQPKAPAPETTGHVSDDSGDGRHVTITTGPFRCVARYKRKVLAEKIGNMQQDQFQIQAAYIACQRHLEMAKRTRDRCKALYEGTKAARYEDTLRAFVTHAYEVPLLEWVRQHHKAYLACDPGGCGVDFRKAMQCVLALAGGADARSPQPPAEGALDALTATLKAADEHRDIASDVPTQTEAKEGGSPHSGIPSAPNPEGRELER